MSEKECFGRNLLKIPTEHSLFSKMGLKLEIEIDT